MRLQFASDLHLEARAKDTFETLLEDGVAPVLALLGDIAPLNHPNLPRFLEWCSERWETIFYVPGITELYAGGAAGVDAAVVALRATCAPYTNIHVLDREAFFSEDGLLVLGCVFWGSMATQSKPIRDLHRRDLEWIKATTAAYSNPVLVLSHFGPVPWVQDESQLWEPADVPTIPEIELLLRKPIVAWAFGHYHGAVTTAKLWNTPTGQTREITLVGNGLGTKRWSREYRRDAVLRLDPGVFYRDSEVFTHGGLP